MKGDKLGRQGGSGNQFPQSGTQPLRSNKRLGNLRNLGPSRSRLTISLCAVLLLGKRLQREPKPPPPSQSGKQRGTISLDCPATRFITVLSETHKANTQIGLKMSMFGTSLWDYYNKRHSNLKHTERRSESCSCLGESRGHYCYHGFAKPSKNSCTLRPGKTRFYRKANSGGDKCGTLAAVTRGQHGWNHGHPFFTYNIGSDGAQQNHGTDGMERASENGAKSRTTRHDQQTTQTGHGRRTQDRRNCHLMLNKTCGKNEPFQTKCLKRKPMPKFWAQERSNVCLSAKNCHQPIWKHVALKSLPGASSRVTNPI